MIISVPVQTEKWYSLADGACAREVSAHEPVARTADMSVVPLHELPLPLQFQVVVPVIVFPSIDTVPEKLSAIVPPLLGNDELQDTALPEMVPFTIERLEELSAVMLFPDWVTIAVYELYCG
jgi:hypothetical protein